MSTEIKDSFEEGDWLRIWPLGGDEAVAVAARQDGRTAEANVDMADFLAAVAAECDAIVIPRTDLPEPNPEYTGVDPEGHRKLALWHLAQAEYLDARPPVPEPSAEDVARMERLITSQPGWTQSATMLAADLLRTGRIEVRP